MACLTRQYYSNSFLGSRTNFPLHKKVSDFVSVGDFSPVDTTPEMHWSILGVNSTGLKSDSARNQFQGLQMKFWNIVSPNKSQFQNL